MRKTRKWLVLVGASSAFWAAQAAAVEPQWHVVNSNPAYELSTSGDLCLGNGATIKLTKKDGAADTQGGAMTDLDAARLAGKRLTLTGMVATKGGAANATIWILSNGASPDAHAFSTTQAYVVRADSGPVARTVRLTVPKHVTRISVGVALLGPGEVDVTHLALASSDAPVVDALGLLDQAIGTIRAHALAGSGIDWDAFLKDAHSHLAVGQPASAAYPAIREAVARLHDGHSHFIGADDAWAHMGNDRTPSAPDIHLISGGIGYVSLPGFSGPADAQLRYVDTIAKAMASAAPMATTGWIVDLREDTGGNMWPMLGAVQSLLGASVVGSSRTPDGRGADWYAGSNLPPGMKPAQDFTSVPVVVLIGPHTSSAGEAVAVAFHGRPATRSFGMPTSGQANSNETAPLKDGSLLIVKAFNDVDRHGQVFGDKVSPDERIEGDDVVASAAEWLSHQARLQGSGSARISP